MTNIEKYNNAFCESFDLTADLLPGLKYKGTQLWDSVGHMTLMSALDDAFDVMLKAEDIIDFSSYEKGQEILMKRYGIDF